MKRYRENTTIYELRREAWNRAFPQNHQKGKGIGEEEMELIASCRLCWVAGRRNPVFLTFGVGLTDTATPSPFSTAIIWIDHGAKSNQVKYKQEKRKKPQIMNSKLEFKKLRIRKENFKN